ncbi:hypothetical protein CDAR_517091, partial [Caerostris darwini]
MVPLRKVTLSGKDGTLKESHPWAERKAPLRKVTFGE